MGKSKSQKGKGGKRPKGANGQAAPAFDILTLEEAAALLRVSVEGVRADAERGAVPGRLIAGEWRFARQTLWEWANSAPMASSQNSQRRRLVDMPVPEETEQEYEAFMDAIRKGRDEVDRITKSGKYAEDE